jgi:uncharacterized protein (DUF1697 family)
MARFVAFLRGINVGGHRITSEELATAFAELGLVSPRPFLASGNVVFDLPGADDGSGEAIGAHLEHGLRDALGYAVPTFLRSGQHLRALAAGKPFPPEALEGRGKPQVIFLRRPVTSSGQLALANLMPADDLLVVDGAELHWLPVAGVGDTSLDFSALAGVIGPHTVRTRHTVDRIVAKFFT